MISHKHANLESFSSCVENADLNILVVCRSPGHPIIDEKRKGTGSASV
jgi:hypothetical protein